MLVFVSGDKYQSLNTPLSWSEWGIWQTDRISQWLFTRMLYPFNLSS